MPQITIDEALCTDCGACVALCNSAHVYETIEKQTRVIRPDECWQCGHCIAVCPTDAISHSDFTPAECTVIRDEALPSLENLITAFSERRSARIFKDKPVSRQVIEGLVDIARWVPSASNRQPVDWIAIDNSDKIAEICKETINQFRQGDEDLQQCVGAYERGEDPIFYKAPVLLLGHVPADNIFGRDDTCYATYNLMLAAERMGLGSCLIGYYIYALEENPDLNKMVNLQKDRRIEVAVILGYPKFKFRRAIPRRKMTIDWL